MNFSRHYKTGFGWQTTECRTIGWKLSHCSLIIALGKSKYLCVNEVFFAVICRKKTETFPLCCFDFDFTRIRFTIILNWFFFVQRPVTHFKISKGIIVSGTTVYFAVQLMIVEKKQKAINSWNTMQHAQKRAQMLYGFFFEIVQGTLHRAPNKHEIESSNRIFIMFEKKNCDWGCWL